MLKTGEEIAKAVEQAHNDCLMILNKSLHEKSPPLFHYTDINGCIGIITSGKIRLTDARYCNDPEEIFVALKLLEEVHNEIIDEYDAKNKGFGYAMTSIMNYLFLTTSVAADTEKLKAKAQAATLKYGIDSSSFKYKKTDVYIMCFSEKSDDLRQWLPYANDGNGTAIGVKGLDETHELADSVFMVRVCYESEESKKDYIRNFYKKMFEIFGQLDLKGNPILGAVFFQTVYVSMYVDVIACKSENYKDEAEWRLFAIRTSGQTKKLFRVSKDIIRPYIEVDLMKPSVLQVVLGPKTEKVLNGHAISDALIQHGYKAEVKNSKVAYR